jgi:signal transduction histidine kinase
MFSATYASVSPAFRAMRVDPDRTAMRIGLTTMFERARMLGGTLEIQRRNEGSSRVVLAVPISMK